MFKYIFPIFLLFCNIHGNHTVEYELSLLHERQKPAFQKAYFHQKESLKTRRVKENKVKRKTSFIDVFISALMGFHEAAPPFTPGRLILALKNK